MKEKYTKKQLEELYYCTIFKDSAFDDGHTFYVAYGQPIEAYREPLFTYASGWTLNELHEDIRSQVMDLGFKTQIYGDDYAAEDVLCFHL